MPGLGTFKTRAHAPVEGALCADEVVTAHLEIDATLRDALLYNRPHELSAPDHVIDLVERAFAASLVRMGVDGVLMVVGQNVERTEHSLSVRSQGPFNGVALAFCASTSLMRRLNPTLRKTDGSRVYPLEVPRVGRDVIAGIVDAHERSILGEESGASLIRRITHGPEIPRSTRWVERELSVPLPSSLRCLFGQASHAFLKSLGVDISSIDAFEKLQRLSKRMPSHPLAHAPVFGRDRDGDFLALSLDTPGTIEWISVRSLPHTPNGEPLPPAIREILVAEIEDRRPQQAEAWVRIVLFLNELAQHTGQDRDRTQRKLLSGDAFDRVQGYLHRLGSMANADWL